MFNLIPWKKSKDGGTIAVRHKELSCEQFPLAGFREEFDLMLNRLFEDRWFGGRFGNLPSLWSESRFDLGWEDRGNEFVFHADVPGFEPEDFDVKISGKMLTVRAEQKHEKKEGNGGSHYRYGSFSRSMTLPHGVDEEKIEARYHSGVLELHLPKSAQVQGKRIEVTSG
jgi:HSP20 family protein